MSAKKIIEQLPDAGRENRLQAANYFLNHPEKISELLQLSFTPSYTWHYKAAWVLEFVVFKDFNLLLPHLDFFIKSLALIKNDSAVRPVAKITYLMVQKHLSSKEEIKIPLTVTQIYMIITVAFDWLIGDYRVATKVQAMQIVFDLGQLPASEKWVLPELKAILSENIVSQSAGYRNRAEKILKRLKNI